MAVISGPELVARAQETVTNRTFEAVLLKSSNTTYTNTTPYATLILDEIPSTAGGYQRLEFTFDSNDIDLYANGASTVTRYITWVHNGNSEPIEFDTILIVERIFAQPLPLYNVVAIQPLGIVYELVDVGDRARFAFRVNIKNK